MQVRLSESFLMTTSFGSNCGCGWLQVRPLVAVYRDVVPANLTIQTCVLLIGPKLLNNWVFAIQFVQI